MPRVLIHCEKGYSSSPMVLIAYLMRRRKEGLDKVVQDVRGKRRMKPNANFMEQLRVWENVEYIRFGKMRRRRCRRRRMLNICEGERRGWTNRG